MQILFTTSNPHKIRELRAILAPLGVDILGLDSLKGRVEEPVEDGETFAANARLKAAGYSKATGLACLAEDSGLEVDALEGAPGVHSARYAGVEGAREERDEANNEKLLEAMREVPDEMRGARFVSALCLVDAEANVLCETRGTYEGVIARERRGENGFGYDPLLFLPELGRSSAELSADEKNARSHRGAAARKLADWLRERPAGELG